jgi:hypothetical protein
MPALTRIIKHEALPCAGASRFVSLMDGPLGISTGMTLQVALRPDLIDSETTIAAQSLARAEQNKLGC